VTGFSRRSTVDLSPSRVASALAEARRRGRALLDLTVSNPTLVGIVYASDITGALATSDPSYEPDPLGIVSARDEVAKLWGERGVTARPDRVVMTASTSEAYAYALKLFCDPGDEVLVPTPSYPLFEHLARLEGVSLRPYRLGYDGAFFVDVDAVSRAASEKSRAIVVVSPNNPTGSFLKQSELSALERLGLPLISDEVFGEYGLGPDAERARSVLDAQGTLVVALDGLSKLAALPQLKLAWMTLGGPDDAVRGAMARLELIADTFLSPSTLVQRALPALLRSRHTAADAIRDRVRRNCSALGQALEGSALSLLVPEGGWSAVLRLPRTRTDEDWTLALLERGVVVQPGFFFDLEDGPYLVLSLITPPAKLDQGIGEIVLAVREG
jgi:aspartate/methionine/tyrosine aminotransferase